MDLSELKQLAYMIRLSIPKTELPAYAADIAETLKFVAQLQAVDTTGVPPMTQAAGLLPRLRDDQVTALDQRDELQRLAPYPAEAGLYLVPKFLDDQPDGKSTS